MKIIREHFKKVASIALIMGIIGGCSKDNGIEDGNLQQQPPSAPVISSISPEKGKFSTEVTILGSSFGNTAQENKVSFNGVQAIIIKASKTALVVEVPQGAGTGPVEVTVDGRKASGPEFTYLPDNARFVNAQIGTDDENDCNSYQLPCATIGYALAQADSQDLVLIADGAYTESFEIEKSITLQGESESNTIIQAAESPEIAQDRVIHILPGQEIFMSNLTIRNGNLSYCDDTKSHGGGIWNERSDLGLTNITFGQNVACNGGGLYTSIGAITDLVNVTFIENKAKDNGVKGNGGGFYDSGGTSSLFDVEFRDNIADQSGGGLFAYRNTATLKNVSFISNRSVRGGGGMVNFDSSPVLVDVSFIANENEHYGGGIFSSGRNSLPDLSNVLFERNSATIGGGLSIIQGNAALKNVRFISNTASSRGGGMFVQESTPILTNVLFTANNSTWGGGMVNKRGAPTLINVSFNGNTAENGGGLYNFEDSNPVLFNSIVWGNNASSISREILNHLDSSIRLFYSIYRDALDSDIVPGLSFRASHCMTLDPNFVNALDGDLRLKEGSPAIDYGNPDTNLEFFAIDSNGTPIDLDGNPRIALSNIDIGAYEFQGN
ncbi:MAG: IPT/TIG domain-containing protein [Flavobacteriaceae bacterium]